MGNVMKKIMAVLMATIIMILGIQANAADRVIRNHSFDLEDIDEIEIKNSVGSIDLRVVEGNEMRIEVEIEGEDRAFFRRQVDVDDIDVEARTRGDKLILSIDDDDDIQAHWYIEMPTVSDIEIDMGVGEIEAEVDGSNLEIDLGVGDVEVYAMLATTGEIEISVGVGDTSIRGVQPIENSRAIVASESEARGEGDAFINVEVGVGDISVELD
jgi:DUF4097 and DUF4098 domain-containing protein YvlB